MKIVEQLSEDKFVIQMEDSDLKNNLNIGVAHDYVEFDQTMGITTAKGLTVSGKFASCANWISARFDIQIDIRAMVDFVLPFLNSHKYCQKDHLKTSDGKDNYCWSNSLITYFDKESETPMAALRTEGEARYSIMSKKAYDFIKEVLIRHNTREKLFKCLNTNSLINSLANRIN